MAIAATNLLATGSASSASSYNTASVNVVAGRLYLLTVASKSASGTGNTPTVTGAGQTWTQVATRNDAGNATRRTTMFRCMPSSNNSGALTIDFAGQAQNLGIDWSLDEITGVKTSGTNGADAVVQSAGGDSNAGQVTTFTVTLSAFASATNAAYGAIASSNNATALTHEGGYTELSDHGVSFARLETEYKASSDTSVSWTVDTKVIMGALAVELAEATATGRSFGVII